MMQKGPDTRLGKWQDVVKFRFGKACAVSMSLNKTPEISLPWVLKSQEFELRVAGVSNETEKPN